MRRIALRVEIRMFHHLMMGKKIAVQHSIEPANYKISVYTASLVHQ